MPKKPRFEVASGKTLRNKYGLAAENRPTIHLDPSCVPVQFRKWIPLAERWGIGDELIRDDCVHKATPDELRELLAFGDAYDAVLTEWLAGPDSIAIDCDAITRDMEMPNQITIPNAGGPRQLALPAPLTARVGQFRRSASV